MSNYIIRTDASEKKILDIKTSSYYTFSPKGSSYKKISSVTIYDSDRINYILQKKLFVKYQRLLNILSDIENNGTSDGDGYMIILDEAAKLKDILELKYKKLLKKELYEQFLNDICNIEEYINVKLESFEHGLGR